MHAHARDQIFLRTLRCLPWGFFLGTFAIVSTMVGEACEKQLEQHDFGNVSSNWSVEVKAKLEDEVKLEIAISLTLMVGIIQVCTKCL